MIRKITSERVIEERGEVGKRNLEMRHGFILKELGKVGYDSRLSSKPNSYTVAYDIPSIPGMRVVASYELEGRSVTPGNMEIFGPASHSTVHFEGIPTLTVDLNYLEGTPDETVNEVKGLILKVR